MIEREPRTIQRWLSTQESSNSAWYRVVSQYEHLAVLREPYRYRGRTMVTE